MDNNTSLHESAKPSESISETLTVTKFLSYTHSLLYCQHGLSHVTEAEVGGGEAEDRIGQHALARWAGRGWDVGICGAGVDRGVVIVVDCEIKVAMEVVYCAIKISVVQTVEITGGFM